MAEQGCIVGVDIDPGSSPLSSKAPRFSMAVLSSNGSLLSKAEGVGLRSLIRRLWRLKPTILAVDNIYEIAKDFKDLVRLLRTLPEGLKLVQVTGTPRDPKPLTEVAASYGLKIPAKPTPLQSAIAVAKLALMGAGFEVKVFEPETRIVISRARSYGAGGMSFDRFKRDARSLVLQATRELCEELRSRGLDYDLFTRGSRRGFDRSLVVVYAPKGMLRGAVKSIEEKGVKVKVFEPSSEEIRFIPREGSDLIRAKQGRYLIIGVDPGMVTGLAILDLRGRPLLLVSRRSMDRLSISRLILDYGSPLIVASDVNPPPTLVEKLSSMLRVILHYPSYSLTVEEKRRLTMEAEENYGIRVKDSHQRDALAAALKAYMHYKNKLEQVEAHLRASGLKVPLDEAKALVIKGLSIQEALRRLVKTEAEEPPSPPFTPSTSSKVKEEIKALQEKLLKQQNYIDKLEAERERLLNRVEELTNKVEELEQALSRQRSEQALKIKETMEVKKLEAQVESLKALLSKIEAELSSLQDEVAKWKEFTINSLRGIYRLIKPINALTPSGVAEAVKEYSIGRGDLVLIRDAASGNREAAEALVKLRVAGVISLTPIPLSAKEVFIKGSLPFLEEPELEVNWLRGLPFLPAEPLDRLMKQAKEKVEEESRRLARSSLSKVLEEYRQERLTKT
ncbi:MAG: hypothetical protein DRJ98_05685 [Thermoprotei archaeon]|nr:MAG: hypothetical protein DRJ98_05685 [Thermoprotei archaeon]